LTTLFEFVFKVLTTFGTKHEHLWKKHALRKINLSLTNINLETFETVNLFNIR